MKAMKDEGRMRRGQWMRSRGQKGEGRGTEEIGIRKEKEHMEGKERKDKVGEVIREGRWKREGKHSKIGGRRGRGKKHEKKEGI